MSAVQLFEENQDIIYSVIKVKFGEFSKAHRIAEINNMELDDFIQVGQELLWKLSLNYDSSEIRDFRAHAFVNIKWRITTEFHKWGLPVKIPTHVPFEERLKYKFTSVDLHSQDGITNDYFAIDHSTDIESEVIEGLELEEYLQDLNSLEKFIIQKKCDGYSDREIGQMLGRHLQWINKRKLVAIKKIKRSESRREYAY